MRAAIFLNGTEPSSKLTKRLLGDRCHIIAADGGANYLHKKRIVPDVIIGDMDSVNMKTAEHFKRSGVSFIRINEQETTDFEKSLNYCRSEGFENVAVLGAASERPDHTMNNFSVMKRFSKFLDVRMFSEEFEIFFADKNTEFSYRRNETLSMMAMPKATGIVTRGLKYPLNNETLEFGKREGSLNESVSESISINYKSGSLLIFRKHFI